MAGFNSLDALAARQQLRMLGGVPATVLLSSGASVDTTVLVDRDVEVVIDNGLAVTRRTVISFIRAEVGVVRSGYRVTLHPGDSDREEVLTIADPMDDDGVIAKGYARG